MSLLNQEVGIGLKCHKCGLRFPDPKCLRVHINHFCANKDDNRRVSTRSDAKSRDHRSVRSGCFGLANKRDIEDASYIRDSNSFRDPICSPTTRPSQRKFSPTDTEDSLSRFASESNPSPTKMIRSSTYDPALFTAVAVPTLKSLVQEVREIKREMSRKSNLSSRPTVSSPQLRMQTSDNDFESFRRRLEIANRTVGDQDMAFEDIKRRLIQAKEEVQRTKERHQDDLDRLMQNSIFTKSQTSSNGQRDLTINELRKRLEKAEEEIKRTRQKYETEIQELKRGVVRPNTSSRAEEIKILKERLEKAEKVREDSIEKQSKSAMEDRHAKVERAEQHAKKEREEQDKRRNGKVLGRPSHSKGNNQYPLQTKMEAKSVISKRKMKTRARKISKLTATPLHSKTTVSRVEASDVDKDTDNNSKTKITKSTKRTSDYHREIRRLSSTNLSPSSLAADGMTLSKSNELGRRKLHDERSKVANSENKNAQEKKSETPSLGMISEKYSSQRDGFDVYVDGGRFLPENATISRVTVIAFSHSTGALLQPFILKSGKRRASDWGFCSLSDKDLLSPTYNLRVEYRHKIIDTSITLLFVIATVDYNGKYHHVGVSVLNLFHTRGNRYQSAKHGAGSACINTGSFQLPIRYGWPLQEVKFDIEAYRKLPRVPCSTLLVRIRKANPLPGGFGLETIQSPGLSAEMLNRIFVKAPNYDEKVYDSNRARPSDLEKKIYEILNKRKFKRKVHSEVRRLSQRYQFEGEFDFRKIEDEKNKQNAYARFLQYSLEKASGSLHSDFPNLDAHDMRPYEPSIGFMACVDGLSDLKLSRHEMGFVIYSVFPPGNFYDQTNFSSLGAGFTQEWDLKSSKTHPKFLDGMKRFVGVKKGEKRNILVLDVRKINLNKIRALDWTDPNDHFEISKFVTPVGYTAIPIFREYLQNGLEPKPPPAPFPATMIAKGIPQTGNGVWINTCSVRLPLLEGPVDIEVLNQLCPVKREEFSLCLHKIVAKNRRAARAREKDGQPAAWPHPKGTMVDVRLVDSQVKDYAPNPYVPPKKMGLSLFTSVGKPMEGLLDDKQKENIEDWRAMVIGCISVTTGVTTESERGVIETAKEESG
ncbi:hypothetical protein AAMO2058_000216600 [Amorphochlora amoebiformis]